MPRRLDAGYISGAWLAFLGSSVLLAVLIGMLAWPAGRKISSTPLFLCCATELKSPVLAAATEYEKEYGVPIHLNFDGSQKLLSELATGKQSDLYISGDSSDLELAKKKELFAEIIPLATMNNGAAASISVAVLKSSANGSAALRFARYLGARDKGLKEFERNGYKPVNGDLWSGTPEIRLLAGAMLRPAIEETITAFEQREGCRVTRVYNGCGILVGQMRAGQKADAYFACDVTFMNQVSDLFLDSTDISVNTLVILVKKGNPRNIQSLKDLGRENLKIGVGHEKQCALGALTRQILDVAGLYNEVSKNVAVQSPAGDMLVNQLRTGSLDAVIAYASNASSAKDELDLIKIDLPGATAVQPFAVGRESPNTQLTLRLLEAIRSGASEERFKNSGFNWQGAAK
jgi:ABC-type molybdate transport system substrate-binding protein